MANTRYYTISEFMEFVTTELNNLNVYILMLNSINNRIKTMTQHSDDFADIETITESVLVDSDAYLDEIITALAQLDLTKFAHEVRVGALVFGASNPGHYHHAVIDIAGDFSDWIVSAFDARESAVEAFDSITPSTGATSLFLVDDIVEIRGVGNQFLEGFFTVTTTGTSAFAVREAPISAVDIDPVFGIVVRLRER